MPNDPEGAAALLLAERSGESSFMGNNALSVSNPEERTVSIEMRGSESEDPPEQPEETVSDRSENQIESVTSTTPDDGSDNGSGDEDPPAQAAVMRGPEGEDPPEQPEETVSDRSENQIESVTSTTPDDGSDNGSGDEDPPAQAAVMRGPEGEDPPEQPEETVSDRSENQIESVTSTTPDDGSDNGSGDEDPPAQAAVMRGPEGEDPPEQPEETVSDRSENQIESVTSTTPDDGSDNGSGDEDPPAQAGLQTGCMATPASLFDQGSLRDPSQDAVDFQPNLELPARLDDLKVRVTHVDSPGSFYVQLTQNNMLLKRLNEMLKQKYGSMGPQNVQWEADMHVAVLINGLWERGQICDTVASTNMAEVRLCDFGNRVFVHFSNLRPLQVSLVGSLALECALRDIRPPGGSSTWTANACDFISDYVTGAVATMTIKEADLTEQQPVPVSLSCNKTGENVCIAGVLVSEGLALKERKQRETYTLVQIDED